jgi:hypothetical protein
MARHKKDTKVRAITIRGPSTTSTKAVDLTRSMEAARDFLGEAFGVRGRVPRERAKSFHKPSPPPSLDANLSYASQQPLTYSTPLPQRAFSAMPSFPAIPILHQPIQYAVTQPPPANPDLDQLRRIDAHYRSINGESLPQTDPVATKDRRLESKPPASIMKHTCADCGRLRSKLYHAEHPIKPGEIPIQEFCRKCQRDASSTSCSSRSDDESTSKCSKKKTRAKARKYNKVRDLICYFSTLLIII